MTSRKSAANKELIRQLLAEVDRGNVDLVDSYYAPDYVDHTPSPIRRLAPGREGVRQALMLFRRAFPDTCHTVEDLVAEGDRVVARISATGHAHRGALRQGVHRKGRDDDGHRDLPDR